MKTATLLLGYVLLMTTSCSKPDIEQLPQVPGGQTEVPPLGQAFLLTQGALDSVTMIIAPSDSASLVTDFVFVQMDQMSISKTFIPINR